MVPIFVCLVVAVADGDTLTASCGEPGGYEQVRVRISAIDAPERGQPYGGRARQALVDLCHQVQARIIERARDHYGRTVADVECRGQDVGQHLVATGMAWVFDRYAKGYGHLLPPQETARAARRGLWADPTPMPPWQWRRQQLQ
ncbi:MAG: thermonuclease family protein [Rubrivivax sp.]|nr:thermonuclease family protein [Rubrivivax sp.]